MTTKLDVTKDRDKYIGGSDMPAVMGISKFRSRYDLLLEKALGKKSDFEGNEYTQYGHDMEPVIRNYLSEQWGNFVDDEVRIDGDLRYHADGWCESDKWEPNCRRLLEVKTTSEFYKYEQPEDMHSCNDKDFILQHYKPYVVQLLLGMLLFNARSGLLAVYERPDDFSLELDPDRLQVYVLKLEDYTDVCDEMSAALEQFRIDRDRLKEDPFLTEEDLQPTELVKLADQALALEQELVALKEAEKKSKEVKEALKKAMEEHGVKRWTTNNGVQITLVADGKDKTVKEFDDKKFIAENEDLAAKYMVEKVKKGRKGYVRITL